MEELSKLRKAQKAEQDKKDDLKNKGFKNYPGDNEEALLSFRSLEREYYHKGIGWYLMAGIFVAISIFYFISDRSFTSAIVFALIFSVTVLYGNHPPRIVEIHFTQEGIYIHKKFFTYKEIKHFWIINSPRTGVHALHFEVGEKIIQTVSIQLHDIEDNVIRNVLTDRVDEDFEKEEPTHHQLRRFLRF